MPLILAIEPDRRQAKQLETVVRGRLQADFVLAESAERALAALGDRVPDLILASALLSPNDELVLGERLRGFDGSAAHVQTLTIPVLAAPRRRSKSRAGGLLSALRLGKSEPEATADGCDPAVFAAQCAEYLERSEAERALNTPADDDQPFAEDTFETVAATEADEAAAMVEVTKDFEPVELAETIEFTESVDLAERVAFTERVEPIETVEPVEAMTPVEAVEPRESDESVPALEPFSVSYSDWTDRIASYVEKFESASSHAEIRTAPEYVAPAFEPIAASPAAEVFEPVVEQLVERPEQVREPFGVDEPAATASIQRMMARFHAIEELESLATIEVAPPRETLVDVRASDEPRTNRDFIELDLSEFLVEEPTAESPIADETDVYEISVASDEASDESPEMLPEFESPEMVPDCDVETIAPAVIMPRVSVNDRAAWIPQRLGVAQLWPPMDGAIIKSPAIAAVEELPVVSMVAPPLSRRAQARHKPIQDEWGFFDPEQCGFAALLAKLDEIIEVDDRSA